MADARLRRIFEERETAQGDQLFGEYDLVPDDPHLEYTPIERVAVLTEAFLPKVDGVSKTSYLTIRYLQQTGREVLIFAPDSAVPSVGPSRVVNLPSVSMPAASETRMALPNPVVARRLEAFKPDLIYLASPAIMTVSGMLTGRHLGVPVIANYQTDLPGYLVHYGAPILSRPMRNWLRYLHNGCHINLVPSRVVRDELRSWGFHRLRIWGRGVNIDRFNPAHRSEAMRTRLLNGRDPDSLLCIYVGRLANEKHVDLLRGIADLDGVALTIIGDGSRREELEALYEGTGTFFTGYLYGEDLGAAFASADVFVFPGPNETFGQVVQEAMASGLPTVVTSRGGVGELVDEGRTGFVVAHDRAAFAAAVQTLRDDPARRLQMSRDARQVAETRPWSAMMGQLERYFLEAYRLNQRFARVFQKTDYQPLPISAFLGQRR